MKHACSRYTAAAIVAATAVLAGMSAYADPVENLVSFSPGATARADEVNGNFSEVADSVNDNDARVAALEEEIAALREQLSNVLNVNQYLSLETVNDQPTVRVSGADLQIFNGMAETATSNGTDDLLIGHDERHDKSGGGICSPGTHADDGSPVANETGCMAAGGMFAVNHTGGQRPGADIVGDSVEAGDAVLTGYAPAARTALYGEAGDVAGISAPNGAVGVVGIGENVGIRGGSVNGTGVHGTSNANYAGYFYSDGYRGVYASSASGYYAGYFTSRGGSSQPGIYVNGSIVASGSKSGYVVDVCLNGGPDPLETGDVVAVVGVSKPVVGEIPVMRVVKATAENASAMVGVVDQRFVVDEKEAKSVARPDTAVPRIATDNAIQRGEYLSVVTLGAYKLIKVDAGSGAIQPGDLLVPSSNPGYAMRTATASSGTIIGKALGALEAGQGTIAVYVTMQ